MKKLFDYIGNSGPLVSKKVSLYTSSNSIVVSMLQSNLSVLLYKSLCFGKCFEFDIFGGISIIDAFYHFKYIISIFTRARQVMAINTGNLLVDLFKGAALYNV